MGLGYKSIEERIWENILDSPQKRFLTNLVGYGIKGFYGTVISMFRIPTLVRKILNGQALANRIVDEGLRQEIDYEGPIKVIGSSFGSFMVGIPVDGMLGDYVYKAAKNNNYAPLIALGATNLVSLTYELARLPRSIKEYRLKEQKTQSTQEAH